MHNDSEIVRGSHKGDVMNLPPSQPHWDSEIFAKLLVYNLEAAVKERTEYTAMLRLDWVKRDLKLCMREARKEGKI